MKMVKYKITCQIPGLSARDTISCREMIIEDGAYVFYEGEYGKTNSIIACYPVTFTIVERVRETEELSSLT
jgi:hypothetical protein